MYNKNNSGKYKNNRNNGYNRSSDEQLRPIHFCKYCRGQVWWETNVPYIGNVQSSDRPVLIISDDLMNSVSSNVIVLPMSSKHKFISESNLLLPFNEKSSIVLGDQPRTVPKENLKNYLYTLSPQLLDQAIRTLLVSVGYIDRTKGIRRMNTEERQIELDSEKQSLMEALKKERDIIDAYIDGGIEHVTSIIGAGTSTAYRKLNAAINMCKSCEVYLDLVSKAELKKINNMVNKRKTNCVDNGIEQPKVKPIIPTNEETQNQVTYEVEKNNNSDMIFTDPKDIKCQLTTLCNRGELTEGLRVFKKTGKYMHPGSKEYLEGIDKYNYLSTLYEIVEADPKLRRDIKKIATSLRYKIQNVKTKLEEAQNEQFLKSAT